MQEQLRAVPFIQFELGMVWVVHTLHMVVADPALQVFLG